MIIALPNATLRGRAFLAVRLFVGLLLLGAAGLKAHGLATDPLSQDSPLLTPRLLIATIEVEIVLGLWLLSGWAVRGARLAGLGFFAILGASSLYLALDGQPPCGCFGRVTVSPWWTFALDSAVVALLTVCRPCAPPIFTDHPRRAAPWRADDGAWCGRNSRAGGWCVPACLR